MRASALCYMFPEKSRPSNDRRIPLGMRLSQECPHFSMRIGASLALGSLDVSTIGDVQISLERGTIIEQLSLCG